MKKQDKPKRTDSIHRWMMSTYGSFYVCFHTTTPFLPRQPLRNLERGLLLGMALTALFINQIMTFTNILQNI